MSFITCKLEIVKFTKKKQLSLDFNRNRMIKFFFSLQTWCYIKVYIDWNLEFIFDRERNR